MSRAEERARELAENQRGHMSVTQALEVGLTYRQLAIRRGSGGWVKVLPNVYRMAGVPETFESMLMAAQLWMGNEGFFTGSTAGFLYGLDGIPKPAQIHIARHGGHTPHPRIKIKRLALEDTPRRRWIGSLRVCSMERCLLDLAADLSPKVVGSALDDALRKRLTTLDRMHAFLSEECGRGRAGTRAMRRLLKVRDDRDESIRSKFEARMLRILKRLDEHLIEANHPVVVGDNHYYLDFFIPSVSLGIECHSFKWHIGKHNQDARRDRRIRALGIELLYFTWHDVHFDEAAVEREIRGAIGRRRGQLFPVLNL